MIFWRLICRCTMSFTVLFVLLTGTIFADETACSSDVCLSLDGGNLNYSSTTDIYGFQFNHDGCASGASGGDDAANGFTVSAS